MRSFIIILVAVFFAFSCQKQTIRQEFAGIDSLLVLRPDSALVLLNSINNPERLPARDRAMLALLKSAALDKNYIDIQSDSLIKIAVDYFSKSKDISSRMRSWYYYGIVRKNAQDYTSAILCFEKAKKDAIELNDYHLLGLIYRNIAVIFSATNNNPESIRYMRLSVDSFEKTHATEYANYAKLSLAIYLVNNQEYDSALALLNSIRDAENRVNYRYTWDLLYAKIAVIKRDSPRNVVEIYNRTPTSWFFITDYAYAALSNEIVGNRNAANDWFSKAYGATDNDAAKASLGFIQARIEADRGHYDRAYSLVRDAALAQDSVTRGLLQQSISNAQRDYYNAELVQQEYKNESLKQKMWFLGIIMALTVIIASLLIIRQHMKNDLRLKDLMAQMQVSRTDLKRLTMQNGHLVSSLFNERIGGIDSLINKFYSLDDPGTKESLFKEIKKQVLDIRKNPDLYDSIEKDLNDYCNGIIIKLRQQVPVIKGENIRLIMLFFAGYSYETIQLIMGKNSVSALKMAKTRLRNAIKQANAPDSDLFLDMLTTKTGK